LPNYTADQMHAHVVAHTYVVFMSSFIFKIIISL